MSFVIARSVSRSRRPHAVDSRHVISRETEKLGISVAPSGAGIDAEIWSNVPPGCGRHGQIASRCTFPDAGPSDAGNFFEISRFP